LGYPHARREDELMAHKPEAAEPAAMDRQRFLERTRA
jgi:hypothetical protein